MDYRISEGDFWGGLGAGMFYHYQFKGKHQRHSPLGVLVALDYTRFRDTRPFNGFFVGMPPESVESTLQTFALRSGLAINLNSSRAERLQVYLQLGYLLLYEHHYSATYAYGNGNRIESDETSYIHAGSPWVHNIYAALDLRYQLGSQYFVGLAGQFSTVYLMSEQSGQPIHLGAALTFGRFLREEDEIEKKKRQEATLQF